MRNARLESLTQLQDTMMKPIPTFNFIDSPHLRTSEPRKHMARMMRAWRNARTINGARQFEFTRVAPHHYLGTLREPGAPTFEICI